MLINPSPRIMAAHTVFTNVDTHFPVVQSPVSMHEACADVPIRDGPQSYPIRLRQSSIVPSPRLTTLPAEVCATLTYHSLLVSPSAKAQSYTSPYATSHLRTQAFTRVGDMRSGIIESQITDGGKARSMIEMASIHVVMVILWNPGSIAEQEHELGTAQGCCQS